MLSNLKVLLGIAADDDSLDEKLKLIISTVTARLKVLLGGIEPPESLDYIIRDVSIIRFNKIGSEGMTSHSVEGESLSFGDNDFAGYMDDIQAFLETQKESAKGRLRFL
jgi:hypothetical protein